MRPATLRTRITLVLAGTAALAVIITGAVMIPLVRSGAVTAARERVAAQVEMLVASGDPAGADAAEGTSFAVIRDGAAHGQAAPFATDAVRAALERSGSYSGIVRGTGGTGRTGGSGGVAVVEARLGAAGVGVIGAFPLSEVERSQWQATVRVLLALAAGLAVAVVAGMLLARAMARPLDATARAARRLAAGQRGVEIPAGGPAETRAVADALTALDGALSVSEGRQREFLLSVSHELRTPLSAIRGYGEALADGLIAPQDAAQVGRTLVDETQRLDRFVADLLALARLEAVDFPLTAAGLDLGALAVDAVHGWQGRAAVLGVTLTARADALPVTGDAHRVRQVLDGLIENALRATPDGGAVSVRVRTAALRTAVIEVSDTGPGLSESDAAVAFDRGVLRARYRDERPVGTGLGLSIAARLVGRMGGSIHARPGVDAGAVFEVRLPVAPPG